VDTRHAAVRRVGVAVVARPSTVEVVRNRADFELSTPAGCRSARSDKRRCSRRHNSVSVVAASSASSAIHAANGFGAGHAIVGNTYRSVKHAGAAAVDGFGVAVLTRYLSCLFFLNFFIFSPSSCRRRTRDARPCPRSGRPTGIDLELGGQGTANAGRLRAAAVPVAALPYVALFVGAHAVAAYLCRTFTRPRANPKPLSKVHGAATAVTATVLSPCRIASPGRARR